jgi:protein-disulfide isomerase
MRLAVACSGSDGRTVELIHPMGEIVKFARYLLMIALLSGSLYSQQPSAHQNASNGSDWRETLVANTQAPVKVMEFFDYQCPYCGSVIPALEAVLKSHSSQVEWILVNNPLPIHPDSMLAHEAALAAGEQGKFWQMHDLLFSHQRNVKLPDLLQYARQLHLDVPRFQERLESRHFRPTVEHDVTLAKALGITATPTFFINGQKLVGTQSAERLQALIEGKPGQASDKSAPSIASLDYSHSPVRGPAEARISIVEFSDLQCPFCARVSPVLQEIMKQYPGEVRWVFKNFPLDFHADSPLAHRAVMAAAQQGKFWEMHDLVFAGQKSIKREGLLEKARALNLDMAQFTADLDSDRLAKQIEADRKEGEALQVNGTPTFFINGKEYSGALTLEKFQSILGAELAVVPSRPSPATPAADKNEFEIAQGPADAPITLTWFSDLQSNLSVKATLLVRQIMQSHPGKIRLVFKNRPLENHPEAIVLHEAALAANAQGKFWQMHDLIVANPQKTTKQDLIAYAGRIGLDTKRFQSELEAGKYRAAIEQDLDEARRRAVQGTPVFFLNFTRIDGLQPQKTFDEVIAERLSQKLQASSR